jgi:nicotinamidase-related amidase
MAATSPSRFVSSRSALLLMDFQNGALSRIADTTDLLDRAGHARRAADAAGMQVVYIRVAFAPDQLTAIPDRNKTFAAIAAAGLLVDGSPGTQIPPVISPRPEDRVFTKTRVSAFSTTELAAFLDERGIDTLVLAGVQTSGVVLSTVRDAADRDYRLLVLEDCCADPDAAVHEMLTTKVFPRQADVTDTAGFDILIGR